MESRGKVDGDRTRESERREVETQGTYEGGSEQAEEIVKG